MGGGLTSGQREFDRFAERLMPFLDDVWRSRLSAARAFADGPDEMGKLGWNWRDAEVDPFSAFSAIFFDAMLAEAFGHERIASTELDVYRRTLPDTWDVSVDEWRLGRV